MLLLLLDASEEDPAGQEATLLAELGNYSPRMLEKPRVTAFSKMDLIAPDAPPPSLGPGRDEVFHISAQARQGLEPLLWELDRHLQAAGSTAEPPLTEMDHG